MAPTIWDLRCGRAMPAAGRRGAAGEVTILLPGDRVFRERDVRVRAYGEGDEIEAVEILFANATLDDGYRRARELAREWRLETRPLDAWYQGVLAGRRRGDESVRYYVALTGPPIAPEGPTPSASVLDSFDDRRPFLLELEFRWG